MNTTKLVVEIRPEKNSGPCGIWTHCLCDAGAALYQQLSQQANWKLVIMLDLLYSFLHHSAHIWFSYICSHYSPLGRFIRIQHNNQYVVGFIAQLLERYTGIVKIIGSNPVRAWFFFRSYVNYQFSSVHSWEGRLYSFWNALWMYIRTQSVRSNIFFLSEKINYLGSSNKR